MSFMKTGKEPAGMYDTFLEMMKTMSSNFDSSYTAPSGPLVSI